MGEALARTIEDDKVNTILSGLTEGKTRDELSIELGYKNYRCLDSYMKRKKWKWNSKTQRYYVEKSELSFDDRFNEAKIVGTKICKVIDLFGSGIEDVMEVAKRTDFRSHVEMAEYMKKNNYMWDSEKNNYVMKTGKVKDKNVYEEPIEPLKEPSLLDASDIIQYLPLLKMLQNNKSQIIEKLNPIHQIQSIPTYLVPGISTVISASMMSSLKLLVKEYAKERHITQKQLLEVAVIEFFNKYGYSNRTSEFRNA